MRRSNAAVALENAAVALENAAVVLENAAVALENAAVVLALGLALGSAIALPGCGSGDRRHGQRAGSEPIPSSRYAAPPPEGTRPLFPGAARPPEVPRAGQRPGGLIGEALAQEEARERAARGDAPQRLEDPRAEGMRIAREAMADMPPMPPPEPGGDDDVCVEAWRARQARGHGAADERQSFLSRCRALPEPEQQCMTPRYQSAHAEECAELQERRGRAFARRADVDVPR